MITLADLPPGARARVLYIAGGFGARRRLMEMGFTPGSIVEVISNFPGPILVMVRGTRVAIGRGVARKIIVQPVAYP